MRRILLTLVLSLSMVLGAPAAVSAAGASEKPARHGVIATYHGRAIDLSKGWAGAQICDVLTRTDVRCYASQAEMRAAHAKILAASGVTAQAQAQRRDLHGCPGGLFSYEYVCLYEYTYWGGRRLQFKDIDYWQNLWEYGFRDMASSWAKTRNPGFKLGDYRGGVRYEYVFKICNPASSAVMPSGWNNVADQIFIYRQYPC
jgi:hypothetical protein